VGDPHRRARIATRVRPAAARQGMDGACRRRRRSDRCWSALLARVRSIALLWRVAAATLAFTLVVARSPPSLVIVRAEWRGERGSRGDHRRLLARFAVAFALVVARRHEDVGHLARPDGRSSGLHLALRSGIHRAAGHDAPVVARPRRGVRDVTTDPEELDPEIDVELAWPR
jgi:hypothetical protein